MLADKITDVGAVTAVSAFFWGGTVAEISPILTGIVLPGLGALWLVVRIWSMIRLTNKTLNEGDEK